MSAARSTGSRGSPLPRLPSFPPFPFGILILMATRRQADCPSYSDDGTRKKVCTTLLPNSHLPVGRALMQAVTRNAYCTALTRKMKKRRLLVGLRKVNRTIPKSLLPASPSRQFSEMSRSDHAGSEQSGLPDKQRERRIFLRPAEVLLY